MSSVRAVCARMDKGAESGLAFWRKYGRPRRRWQGAMMMPWRPVRPVRVPQWGIYIEPRKTRRTTNEREGGQAWERQSPDWHTLSTDCALGTPISRLAYVIHRWRRFAYSSKAATKHGGMRNALLHHKVTKGTKNHEERRSNARGPGLGTPIS